MIEDNDNTNCESEGGLDLEDISDNETFCPVCGSGETMILGKLGNKTHYRCSSCGMIYSN